MIVLFREFVWHREINRTCGGWVSWGDLCGYIILFRASNLHRKFPILIAKMEAHGFEIVPWVGHRPRSTAYKYDNAALSFDGVLWSCENYVMYQSFGVVTEWHGRFDVLDRGNRLVILFDYKGRDNRLKSVVLFRTAPNVYKGWDYRCRYITMTKLGEFEFDRDEDMWYEALGS